MPHVLAWTLTWLVALAQCTGEVAGALGHARQALAIADKAGSSINRMLAYMILGLAHLLNDEWEAAVEAEEGSLRLARESRAGLVWEPQILAYLSAALLGRGDVARALECADEAVARARRYGTRPWEADALLARARALLRLGGADARTDIEANLTQALAIVHETGSKCRAPFILEARVELAALLGDGAQRMQELRGAHRLFIEMGATGHAERLRKCLAEGEP